jgi:hypothetical protein
VSPRLSSARAAAPDAVIGTWEPAPPDSLRGHSRFSWTLFRFDKPETGPAVTGVSSLGGNRSLIMLADSLCRAPYGLVCQYRKTMGVNTFVVSDTVRFNGIDKGDTVRPVLQQPFPGGLVSLSPRIRLVLSEPVSIVSPLFLADSLRDTVMLVSDSGFADTVVMRTNRRLHAGSKYRLTLLRTDMRDIAGNYLKPRDSTDTVAVMLFTTAPPAFRLTPDVSGSLCRLPVSPCSAGTARDVSGSIPFRQAGDLWDTLPMRTITAGLTGVF